MPLCTGAVVSGAAPPEFRVEEVEDGDEEEADGDEVGVALCVGVLDGDGDGCGCGVQAGSDDVEDGGG